MNNMIENKRNINLGEIFSDKEKKDLKKVVVKTREKLIAAQIENRKQLPFASGKTLLRVFD